MIQFSKPNNLNGLELTEELAKIGIHLKDSPYLDADQKLWLDIDPADEAKAAYIVAAHNGTIIAPEPTVEEKLASVGLSLFDLKAALGLE